MKRIHLLLAGALLFGACNNGSNSTDSTDSAKNANKSADSAAAASGSVAVAKDASDFAVTAANAGMTEVEASKLADLNAKSQQVKDFAAMMITDHTQAGSQLKSIADSKNITLPATLSDDSRKKVDDLSTKKGTDFDKAYINLMVAGHKDAVDLFQNAANNCSDSTLKNFAATTLPTLQKHKDAVMAIKAKQ